MDQNTNFQFHHSSIQNFDTTSKFDCILCSQVLQHIQTHDVLVVLKKIRSFLNPFGYLILLTTNCLGKVDEYVKVNCNTNEHIHNITEEQLNQCVINNDIFLPSTLFAEESLRKMLEAADFKIIFLGKFNGYPKIKGDNFVFAQI